ncbi:hypothetical protein V1634_22875 [Plantactinospora veratri]|uniref:WXG100 family type VII secretion target n=1 Tax=Plantactinospora veratri TaxID=1436122 RepID=A0ABU7SIC4_9ACTN
MTTVSVELSDLRGWAQQVGRVSADMGSARDYAAGQIADADFGRILELITGPYAGMIPKFHNVLSEDGLRLGKTRDGLNTSATAYREADERSSGRLTRLAGGQTGLVTDDGEANGFGDPGSPAGALVAPGGGGAGMPDLPEVSFGFVFDKVCDLVVWVGGPDPREKVTRWLAGDIDKAARHVEAWRAVAQCLDLAQANLASGRQAITRTWSGDAANAATAHVDRWTASLTEQAGAMRKMGDHLWDMIDHAVKMAQVVVDIIRTLVSLVSAALSNAAIPAYGQWKLIQTVKEGITMVWKAIKVVQVFLNALTMLISTIELCVDYFSVAKLPPAPVTGPVPAMGAV